MHSDVQGSRPVPYLYLLKSRKPSDSPLSINLFSNSLEDGKLPTRPRSSKSSLHFCNIPPVSRAYKRSSFRGLVKNASGQEVWELAGRWTSQLVARKAGAGHGDLQPDDKINASAKEYLVRVSRYHLSTLLDPSCLTNGGLTCPCFDDGCYSCCGRMDRSLLLPSTSPRSQLPLTTSLKGLRSSSLVFLPLFL